MILLVDLVVSFTYVFYVFEALFKFLLWIVTRNLKNVNVVLGQKQIVPIFSLEVSVS